MNNVLKGLSPEQIKRIKAQPLTVGGMLDAIEPLSDQIKTLADRDPDAMLESTLMAKADTIGKSIRNYCDDVSYSRSEIIDGGTEVKSWLK